jgi:hypothetical protein
MNQQRSRGSRPSLPSPSTGTLGAAVAVVALLLGFLILRDVRASSTTNGAVPTSAAPTPGEGSVDPSVTTTTLPLDVNGFKIQVANASGIAGSAGVMTGNLQDQGYKVLPAKNVAAGTAKRKTTGVFYLGVLGGAVEVTVMPVPVPLEDGTLGDACILILLGTDLSGKPLPSVGTDAGGAATTTVPPAG